jgi:signal transduction histidine kinase
VVYQTAFSQTTVNKNETPSEKKYQKKINKLLQQSVAFRLNDSKKSAKFAFDACNIGIKNNDLNLSARAASNLGDALRLLGKNDLALRYLQKALVIFELFNIEDQSQAVIGNIALTYHAQSNFTKALNYSLVVLRYSEKKGDTLKFIASCNSVANIYYSRGDFKESLQYFKKAISQANLLSDKHQQMKFVLNQNIANVLLDLGEMQNAETYINKTLQIAEKSGVQYFEYTAFIQKGYLYYEQGRYFDAIELFEQALTLAQEMGNPSFEASSHMEIGRSFYNWAKISENRVQKKDFFAKAVLQLEVASLMFLEILNTNEYKYCQELLSECYEGIGNYKKAFVSFKTFKYQQDSLFNAEKTEEITRLEMEHQFSKKQDSIEVANRQKILLRDLEIKQQKNTNVLLLVVLLIFIGSGIALFVQLRFIRRKNLELARANQIKIRFFNMINHDLRSPVANLLQSLYIQKEHPSFHEVLDKNIVAVENLYQSMEDMLLWSKGQMEQFQPHERSFSLLELVEDVVALYPNNIQFDIDNQLPNGFMLSSDQDYLKAILRNLISNAIHALKGRSEPKICVRIWQEEACIKLSIEDNGRGANQKDFDNLFTNSMLIRSRGGLGLQMVRDLTHAIHCDVQVDSVLHQGTKVTLSFADK